MRFAKFISIIATIYGVTVIMALFTALVVGTLMNEENLHFFAKWAPMPILSFFFVYLCYCGIIAGVDIYKMMQASRME